MLCGDGHISAGGEVADEPLDQRGDLRRADPEAIVVEAPAPQARSAPAPGRRPAHPPPAWPPAPRRHQVGQHVSGVSIRFGRRNRNAPIRYARNWRASASVSSRVYQKAGSVGVSSAIARWSCRSRYPPAPPSAGSPAPHAAAPSAQGALTPAGVVAAVSVWCAAGGRHGSCESANGRIGESANQRIGESAISNQRIAHQRNQRISESANLQLAESANLPPAIRHSACICHPAIAICHLAIRHLPSATCHLPPAIRHLPSAIRHLPSATCHLPSAIRHLPSAIRYSISTARATASPPPRHRAVTPVARPRSASV